MQYWLTFLSDKELVDQEIKRLRVIDKERDKVHRQNMKGISPSSFIVADLIAREGFLNKAEKKGNTLAVPNDELDEVKEAFIEELKE